MLRAILRPAPLGLLVLVLALATGFAFLGQWQLDRSRSTGSDPALEVAQPLTDVLAPASTFRSAGDGQVVTARGRFRGDGQVLVPGRQQDGRTGSWVVAPFDVEGGATSAPAVLAVVRGWVPASVAARGAGDLAPPPGGETTLTGRLLVGEPARGVTTGAGGQPSVAAVAPTDLVNLWGAPIWTGFVIASSPSPAAPLEAVTSEAPTRGTDLRALSYGIQWFLFGGLALLAWWRVVRERFLPPSLDGVDDPLVALEARRGACEPGAPSGSSPPRPSTTPPTPPAPGPAREPAPHRAGTSRAHQPQHVEAP